MFKKILLVILFIYLQGIIGIKYEMNKNKIYVKNKIINNLYKKFTFYIEKYIRNNNDTNTNTNIDDRIMIEKINFLLN